MKLGMFIDFYEQWSQFFHKCNWYTFEFISIEFENDEIMGGFEASITVMGLGVRWRWNFKETETTKHLDHVMKEFESGNVEIKELD